MFCIILLYWLGLLGGAVVSISPHFRKVLVQVPAVWVISSGFLPHNPFDTQWLEIVPSVWMQVYVVVPLQSSFVKMFLVDFNCDYAVFRIFYSEVCFWVMGGTIDAEQPFPQVGEGRVTLEGTKRVSKWMNECSWFIIIGININVLKKQF